MSAFTVTFIALGGAAVIGAAVYFVHRAGVKRREALERVARDLRFSFSPGGDGALLSGLGDYHLFSRGHTKRMSNLLRGSRRDDKAAVFDYRYTVGAGKHQRTFQQTVCCFDLEGRSLPRFCVQPERAWHKVGALVGYDDIDFEKHPEFSKRYFLRGDDEQGVRRIFGRDLVAFFEKERGVCMEGGSGYLLFYRAGRRIKPEEIRAFLEKGARALDLVRRQA
ncbi:MAG: hypothetical protein C4574_05965 [Candidatus Latescibacterota bacterium]|jgi:hypothetical protein|nr:MAG: hypothetical protein C4574_05965 [Candidatus Latescibacterota bacterium]